MKKIENNGKTKQFGEIKKWDIEKLERGKCLTTKYALLYIYVLWQLFHDPSSACRSRISICKQNTNITFIWLVSYKCYKT